MRRIHGILGLALFASASAVHALGCFYSSTIDDATDCERYPHMGCSSNSGMGGGSGSGMPATCNDGTQDANETDVDCGGSCAQCGDGKQCVINADCTSGVCMGVVCQAPTCMDGVLNGNETGADCGGDCSTMGKACAPGDKCKMPTDCTGQQCDNGTCTPNCMDQTKNNGETDVDCGGTCPLLCNGYPCTKSSECKSNACGGGLCRLPMGAMCTKDVECASVLCSAGQCSPCGQNGDCKTTNVCNTVTGACKIVDGEPCGTENVDCKSGYCIQGLCLELNNNKCAADTDCLSNLCINTTCTGCASMGSPMCKNGVQCVSGNCPLSSGAYCSLSAMTQCNAPLKCAGFPPTCQ